ncbi:DUF4390 domain-containing protein [Chitinibacter sp. SCUT-21]|uniref:DUF4390 domain-containing protein n=1 Tax=Chitinibacter sp. SCUT-21 TaxID=2970891 RepID=UPI0035A626D3
MSWRYFSACLLLLLAIQQGHAAEIRGTKMEASVKPQQIELFAKYSVVLNSDLEDALKNGLTLPFVYEFKLSKPRMYAWYRQVAEGFGPNAQLALRLSYLPLTKQYRVASNSVTRHFNSLEEALAVLGQLKHWKVLDNANIDPEDFAGRIRLRLDGSQLPKTYQVSTIGNANWQLESNWNELQVLSAEAEIEQ